MLTITIPSREFFDEENEIFVYSKEQTIRLEHSLVSISKWEAIFEKPFLESNDNTWNESLEYIRCMTITQNVPRGVYNYLTDENLRTINEYMEANMTATTVPKSGGTSREIVTSELIYYWMIALDIPFECQKWHINRLLMLINVCNVKNSPPKKRSPAEIMARNRTLNESRKKKYNTRG